MAGAKLETTRTPGIYRRGSKYVVVYHVNGKQRRETARTMEDARRLKRAREVDRDRGRLGDDGRVPFREYAEEWVARYQGNGRRGFTEETRASYRRHLELYAYPYFEAKLGRTVATISPRDIAGWIAWLCNESEQGKALADASVRRILAPVRACLSTARREGLITSNPATDAVLPRREAEGAEDEEVVRAMTRTQLEMFLRVVHPDWRLMFRFLAATGLRWGELAALRWSDVTLDGSSPSVTVRRSLTRGTKTTPSRFKAPKSSQRRHVPLAFDVADDLRAARPTNPETETLVFPATNGKPLRYENVRRRLLQPAAGEAGVPWVGFHTFRHTCASLLFDLGRNPAQVQRWLGHQSAAFTLSRYVHLMDNGAGEGLDLSAELGRGDNRGTTQRPETGRNAAPEVAEVLAL
jgi:integrase